MKRALASLDAADRRALTQLTALLIVFTCLVLALAIVFGLAVRLFTFMAWGVLLWA